MGLEAAIIRRPMGWIRESPLWDKLSKSGEALELLIPGYTQNSIVAWSNDSCMVISQINAAKCRGYRGTKSITGKNPTNQKSVVVKAQRVDGSYIGNLY